jgi:hypothetical protein
MNRWYSARGARRGLLLAGFAAACWSGWLVGYVQGARAVPRGAASLETSVRGEQTALPRCPQLHRDDTSAKGTRT